MGGGVGIVNRPLSSSIVSAATQEGIPVFHKQLYLLCSLYPHIFLHLLLTTPSFEQGTAVQVSSEYWDNVPLVLILQKQQWCQSQCSTCAEV